MKLTFPLKNSQVRSPQGASSTVPSDLREALVLINDCIRDISGLDGGEKSIPRNTTTKVKGLDSILFGSPPRTYTEKTPKPQAPRKPWRPSFLERVFTPAGAEYRKELADYQEALKAWPGEKSNWDKGGLDEAAEPGKVLTRSKNNRFAVEAEADFVVDALSIPSGDRKDELPTGLKHLRAEWDREEYNFAPGVKSLSFHQEDGKDIYHLVKDSDTVKVLRKQAGDVYTRLDEHAEIVADHVNGTLSYSKENRKSDAEPIFIAGSGPPQDEGSQVGGEDGSESRMKYRSDGTFSYELFDGVHIRSDGTSGREMWNGATLNTDGTVDIDLGGGWSHNTNRGLERVQNFPA